MNIQERAMNRYTIVFADGTIINLLARDREDAQERAIELLEDDGIVHCEIRSIRRSLVAE